MTKSATGILGAISTLAGLAADATATVLEASQAKTIAQLRADKSRLSSALATAQKTIESLAHDLDVRAGVIVDLRRGKAEAEARANGFAARVNELEAKVNAGEVPSDPYAVPSDGATDGAMVPDPEVSP